MGGTYITYIKKVFCESKGLEEDKHLFNKRKADDHYPNQL